MNNKKKAKKATTKKKSTKKKVKPKMTGDGRIYAYRASVPTTHLEQVEEQLSLVHKYRNKLVELELRRREQVDQAVLKLAPDLPPTEAALEAIDAEILAAVEEQKKTNIKQRGRSVTREAREALKALRARRKELYKKRRDLRKQTFSSPAWKVEQDRINEEATAAQKTERAASGLYWGSYLPVEDAAKAFRKGAPPRFKRWTGEGKLGVQIQKLANKPAFDPAKLLSCSDTRLRLELHPDGIWIPGKRRPKKLGDALLHFRIGSDESRKPILAQVPIRYHRPLPKDCVIKWTYLQRRKRGTKTIWEVCFVLQGEHGAFDPPDRATEGKVGIDVGWRKMPDDRLRIAVYSGSDGQEGELCLPGWWLGEMRRVERIRGHRDTLMDEVKVDIKAWHDKRGTYPDWFDDRDKNIQRWRSAGQLAGLTIRWRERLGQNADDDAMQARLETWRHRDKHLYEYEAHLRAQLQGSRRDLYRKFAAQLSRRYATALIEDLDLRKFHQLAPIEDGGDKGTDSITDYARDACLSHLFEAIKSRFLRHEKINPANTTKQCHACRNIEEDWTDHAKVDHTCPNCSAVWDQDTNAARNLLYEGGDDVTFNGPAVAPTLQHTYTHKGPNRARRRAQAKRRKEKADRKRALGAA